MSPRADVVHQVDEHIERLLLVLDQRVLLAVASETDSFLEVIHREQVVFPLAVDDVEHDHALGLAQQLRPEHDFLFLVFLLE